MLTPPPYTHTPVLNPQMAPFRALCSPALLGSVNEVLGLSHIGCVSKKALCSEWNKVFPKCLPLSQSPGYGVCPSVQASCPPHGSHWL